MATHSRADEAKGKRLLTAVERLVASDEAILAGVEECRAKARQAAAGKGAEALTELTARELVRRYSNRAAIAGAAASAPGLLPGLGSLAAVVAGTFAELAYLLKCEVEMSLSLLALYGFELRDVKERQLAFLLASVGTYDAQGGSFFGDVVRAEGVALWNYGPRRLGRFLVSAMTSLALSYVWRGFLKAVPLVGMVVGSSVNKVLTRRVGERVAKDLRTRRELLGGRARTAARRARASASATPKRKAPPLKVVQPRG